MKTIQILKLVDSTPQGRLTVGADREMILNGEDQWPCWPLLPVKNTIRKDETGFPELGVIVAGKPLAVRLSCLFDFNPDAPAKQYASIEDLLADGWIVD